MRSAVVCRLFFDDAAVISDMISDGGQMKGFLSLDSQDAKI